MTSEKNSANFPCRLCAGTNLRLYHTMGNGGDYRYYQCSNCKLVNYDLADGTGQEQYVTLDKDPTDDNDEWNRDKDQSLRFISKYLQTPGSMLDIGCGSGRLLYVAKRAGWQVKGLELFDEMAEMVRDKLEVEVVVADFLEVDRDAISETPFDLICLRHVLEHLPDCKLAMSKLRELLRPGGHVLIEIPNVESFSKKTKRFLTNIGLRRPKYPEEIVIGHVSEFCKESFEYLLKETGFTLVRWETYSRKPLTDYLYNRIHVGNNARALIRRTT